MRGWGVASRLGWGWSLRSAAGRPWFGSGHWQWLPCGAGHVQAAYCARQLCCAGCCPACTPGGSCLCGPAQPDCHAADSARLPHPSPLSAPACSVCRRLLPDLPCSWACGPRAPVQHGRSPPGAPGCQPRSQALAGLPSSGRRRCCRCCCRCPRCSAHDSGAGSSPCCFLPVGLLAQHGRAVHDVGQGS